MRVLRHVRGGLPDGALVPKLRAWARAGPGSSSRVATTCPYCGVGCQFYLEVKDGKIVQVTSKWDAPANHGWTCVKGRFGWDFVHHPDRLTKPLMRREKGGPLEEVDLGRSAGPGGDTAQGDQGRVRDRRVRRAHLGQVHQRGELCACKSSPGR